MKRVRTKNLDDETIKNIAAMLDGWSGKLTWNLYIEAIDRRYGLRYTRQALHTHESIRLAFEVRKRALSSGDEEPRTFDGPPELRIALDENARLEGENQRLQAENQALLEQFVRWVSRIGVIEPGMIGVMRPLGMAPKRDFEGLKNAFFCLILQPRFRRFRASVLACGSSRPR